MFENLFAAIRLNGLFAGAFPFWHGFNDRVHPGVESICQKIIEAGEQGELIVLGCMDIVGKRSDEFELELFFHNYYVCVWNTNKYYGWLTRGYAFNMDTGEVFHWDAHQDRNRKSLDIEARPHAFTMAKVRLYLEDPALRKDDEVEWKCDSTY